MPNNSKRLSDEFPELFHYTTVEAFKNIYKEQKLRATHYEDLTDSSELRRFRLKVSEFIKPVIVEVFNENMWIDVQLSNKVNRHGGIDVVVAQEAEMHLDTLHQNTFGKSGLPETFICSFCTHNAESYEAQHGLLSQWRGYAAGGGVAIVLNTLGIEERMQHEKDVFAHPLNHIGNIKYDDDDVGIRKNFCDVFEYFPGILRALYENKTADYVPIFNHFVYGSTLVKHHAFYEEKEVRIVVSMKPTSPDSIFNTPEIGLRLPKELKKIKYKANGNSEMRYIELFGDDKLPITRVIVGPSRFQNLNYQTISELVKETPDIKVEKSNTPFSA